MMTLRKLCQLGLATLFLRTAVVSAIRGSRGELTADGGNPRREKELNIALFNPNETALRHGKKGGNEDDGDDSEEEELLEPTADSFDDMEQDDPAETNTGKNKNRGKKGGKYKGSSSSTDPSISDDYDGGSGAGTTGKNKQGGGGGAGKESNPKGTEGGGKQGKNGMKLNGKDDEEDDDPEGDDPETSTGGGGGGGGGGSGGGGGGGEQSPDESRLTSKRQMPTFSIHYTVGSSATPGTGDYNELAIVTTEFLDGNFDQVFKDEPTSHAYTSIETYRVREERLIEYQVASHFYIPGNVPTETFLYEKLEECFDPDTNCLDRYLNELKKMSHTNPFSKTTSMELFGANPGQNIEDSPQLPSDPKVEPRRNTLMLIIIIAGSGCLVLVLVSFLWVHHRKPTTSTGKGGARLQRTRTTDEGTIVSESAYGTGFYGNDDGTVDLESIGARAKRGGSRGMPDDLEDISLDDAYTDVSPDLQILQHGDEVSSKPGTFNIKEYEDYLARYDIDDADSLVLPSLQEESSRSSNDSRKDSTATSEFEFQEPKDVPVPTENSIVPHDDILSRSSSESTEHTSSSEFPDNKAAGLDEPGAADSGSLGLKSSLHDGLTGVPSTDCISDCTLAFFHSDHVISRPGSGTISGDTSSYTTYPADSDTPGEGEIMDALPEKTEADSKFPESVSDYEQLEATEESNASIEDQPSLAMGIIGDTYNYLQAISAEFDEEDRLEEDSATLDA